MDDLEKLITEEYYKLEKDKFINIGGYELWRQNEETKVIVKENMQEIRSIFKNGIFGVIDENAALLEAFKIIVKNYSSFLDKRPDNREFQKPAIETLVVGVSRFTRESASNLLKEDYKGNF